jgi:hypothetical protein
MNPDWKSNKEFWRIWAGEVADEYHLKYEVLSYYEDSTADADESWTYHQFRLAAVHALWDWDIA